MENPCKEVIVRAGKESYIPQTTGNSRACEHCKRAALSKSSVRPFLKLLFHSTRSPDETPARPNTSTIAAERKDKSRFWQCGCDTRLGSVLIHYQKTWRLIFHVADPNSIKKDLFQMRVDTRHMTQFRRTCQRSLMSFPWYLRIKSSMMEPYPATII